jgi:phage terminase large subunit GpA-like protein
LGPTIARACASGKNAVRKCLANAWKCRQKESPAKWVPRKVRLDNTIEAGAGRFDLDRRPWWKDVLADLDDPEVQSVAMKAATQIGKTLTLITIILWCAENQPAPAMLVVPDQDAAVEMRDRIYATARATIAAGGCTRLRIPPQHKWNLRYIHLGSMRVHLAWSGSRQRLRGKPCRYVFLTETDVYGCNKKAGDPIAAAHQRTKAFFRGLHYHESSPSSTSERRSEISQLEEQCSARYRWYCPCPKCGHKQELRFFTREFTINGEKQQAGGFGGLKNKHNEWHTQDEARTHAHYVCEKGCLISNDQKQDMLAAGEWRTIDGEKPKSRHSVGRHLWSIHSESISFGTIAAEYIKHRDEGKIPEFWGNWLGLEWKPQVRLMKWQTLGHRLAAEHTRKTVPAEAWFLTAGVDVQGDTNGVRYVVRAWAPNCTSWLVDWGRIDRLPGDENDLIRSDLRQLGQLVLGRQFPTFEGQLNVWNRRELTVKLLNIDTGHVPLKVHHWMRSLPEEWIDDSRPGVCVRAIRGDHEPPKAGEKFWRYNRLEAKSRSDEEYEGGMGQWRVYVYPFYEELLEKLSGQPHQPGSWHVTADCLTQGRSYLEQVCNFGPKQVTNKDGRHATLWSAVNGRIDVDFWDCEIYALVAAQMCVGSLGWNPEAWDNWRKQVMGPKPQEVAARRRRQMEDVPMLDDR